MRAYIEVVFLDNFLIDYMLLKTLGFLLYEYRSTKRSLLAALFGAVYAVAAPTRPFLFLLHPTFKVAVSLVMVLIAQGFRDIKHYLTAVGLFYLISFSVGGILTGIGFLMDPGLHMASGGFVLSGPGLWLILLGTLAFSRIVQIALKSIQKKSMGMKHHIELHITLFGEHFCLNGFVDTGNSLCDPIDQLPIIVVNPRRMIKRDGTYLLQREIQAHQKTRYIPTSTVLGQSVLCAAVPECIEAVVGEHTVPIQAAVALSKHAITVHDALVPQEIAYMLQGGQHGNDDSILT